MLSFVTQSGVVKLLRIKRSRQQRTLLRALGESRLTRGEEIGSIANSEDVVHPAMRELGEMEEKLQIAVNKQCLDLKPLRV